MLMSSTYIKDTKYQLLLYKIVQDSSKILQKKGLSIYKPTLELNLINPEIIDFSLGSNSDFLEAKVSVGFICICGIPCFLFSCNNDIKEKGQIDFKQKSKVYKIKNIQYIPLISTLTPKAKNIIETEFNHVKDFLLKEGLYYCDDSSGNDIDIKGEKEPFQEIKNKYKLNENFQYNHDLAPNYCKKILSNISKGYYKTIHYTNTINEKGDINIVMRNRIYDNNKYLFEIEIFIPPTQIHPEIFQTTFYAFLNECDDESCILKNLFNNFFKNLSSFDQKESDKKLGLIINFYNNKKDNSNSEIENISNFEIINLSKINVLETTLYKYIESFKSVGYNYKFNNIDNNIQKKLLILKSDDLKNLFSMIKIVSALIFSLFLKDRSYKDNVINKIKEEITNEFKNAEEKLNEFTKTFPKRLDINKINDKNFEKIRKIMIIKKESKEENNSENNFETNQIEYSNIHNNNSFKIFIGTYNVNALESEDIKTVNLTSFLFPEKLNQYFSENHFPVFYCIGLEEIVDLNPKNVLIKPKSRVEEWEERISSELQKKFNYILLCKEHLVGILLLFYVKSTEIKYIRNIHMEELKAGFMGYGNKGCCFLDFEYRRKKYGFCSCHLPAGQKQKHLMSRKDTFNHILDFKVGKSETEFKTNDFYFIFGDLNFRTVKIGLISLKNHVKILSPDPKEKVDDNVLRGSFHNKARPKFTFLHRQHSLINLEDKIKFDSNNGRSSISNINDRLNQNFSNYFASSKANPNIDAKKNDVDIMDENTFTQYFFSEFLGGEELKNFNKTELAQFNIEEGEIKFPPTYKYKKNTNFYNISKRVPSWTDRILFKNSENITSLYYDRVNLTLSDHKPIVGFFEIKNCNY